MKLTTEEKRIIKQEGKIGIVFALLIILFGGIFNLYYIYGSSFDSVIGLIVLDLLIIVAAFGVYYKMNKPYWEDLKKGVKEVKTYTLDYKNVVLTQEAGSGALYIPVLGDLFPKLWGPKMNSMKKFQLIANERTYYVEEELFNQLQPGNLIDISFSWCSKTFLGIDKHTD